MVMLWEGDNNTANEGRALPVRAANAPGPKSIEVPLRVGLVAVSLACWGVFLDDHIRPQPANKPGGEARPATSSVDTDSTHAEVEMKRPGVAR